MSSGNSSTLVRIAILGCGPRGIQMAKIVALLTKSFKLTAMSDMDAAARERVKSLFPDLELYESSDDLLDKAAIDAVIVETPPAFHAEYVCKALNRNIAVMSEIPVAETLEEADLLYKTVKSSKALFMTGATANYRQKSRYMLKLKKEGILGNAAYVEAEYMHDLRSSNDLWRKTYE
ncbi:MAG: Gfo/Idh/MocA family oxidoreductase, partial [Lentisphaeria bacterium]|nr:Gfo/Idh/MocA family oxidoreductase [Lentisphaeria bacterium]